MTGTGPPARRGAGRPTREQAEARHAELLDTALDLFLEGGYEATTIELIASRVGMTKRTIYARYPEKSALFLAAVLRAIERQAVPREVLEDLDDGDLAGTLKAVARLRIEQVTTPDGLRLQRIVNTESYRFPEIFVAAYELNTALVVGFVADLLDRAAAAGRIAPTNSDQAARAFMSMVVGSQVRAIAGGRPPAPEKIDERVEFTVHLLLDGLRPR
ncbi:TetR/AcrR family transcriptional regulator [Actinomadura sp. WMMB 499]|uniref:TetR/AcrR family transcriptional regulator n=1 Tax=Actinomadura sp. WMMB 499 TaxID=1219491 RepID=UPI0012460FC5|nr:TetR/AcrR family transcriptional regulator [Actinomadura sp. WMMB 499]QFG20192.1 TetR/AcrR family transcriptional regulator [Actinomadura sp. WMMB 499]